MERRKFPSPWRVERAAGNHFVIKEANGFSLAHIYQRKPIGFMTPPRPHSRLFSVANEGRNAMSHATHVSDPSTWDPALDAVVAAPAHHKVVFENESLRVLEVTLAPNEEEPIHHHRWPSVFVFDSVKAPIHDFAPDGTMLPPNRDVVKAVEKWDGQGCLVVHMAPQPAGRVLNASDKVVHGIRVEMKSAK